MKELWNKLRTLDHANAQSSEPLWQTFTGCVLFWAGLLALCWIL